MDTVSVFCIQISNFPSNIFEEAVFSPSYVFGTFIKNQVGIVVWVNIWVFYCVLIVFIYVFVLVSFFFHYYVSIV
jgi:hypothetical protein